MKKKILSLLLVFSSLALNVQAAYTAADIDYSDELSEIKSLMEQCDAKGITYDYESINYHTIERFEGYIKQDINDGIAEDIINYNVSVMDDLCAETVSALTSYLNGTVKPKKVSLPDMSNTAVSEKEFISGNKPVYSIGYGHGSNIFEEIQNMNKFGASNVQVEIGPTEYIDYLGSFNVKSSAEYTHEIETKTVHGGNFALKTVVTSPTSSNVYYRMTQEIACSPNTTYEFGAFAKIKDNSTNGLSVKLFGNDWDWDTSVAMSPCSDWTEYSGSFTTTSTQTKLVFSIIVEGEAECYFDDMYVRKTGTTDNILVNGNMEGAYKSKLDTVKKALVNAEKNNVGINLLLSPHYFPEKVADVEYNTNAYGFLKYNINSDAAKVVVEDHIRRIVSEVKDYTALSSIILTNEPEFITTDYPDFYNPLFRAWLKEKHGTIGTLNTAYNLSEGFFGIGKTSYDSFNDIVMPTSSSDYSKAIYYDWILFNDEISAKWHKWMADIVKEYTDIPLSIKVMNTFRWAGESSDKFELRRGTDIELFDEFTDLGGNDVYDVYNDPYSYWVGMMFYDYMSSVTGKPLYNSETHLIQDGNKSPGTAYEPETAAHSANHMWTSAMHGVSMHSMWIWAHVNSSSNQAFQSVLTRPDAVADIGKTALDMSRLSNEISEMRANDAKVALFYSKPTRVYTNNHMLYTYRVYQALINAGVKVGFVSENSLDKLPNYDILIMGNVTNGTADAVSAVESFMTNGGKVLYFGNPMTKNEYNVSKSNNIASNANSTSSTATATSGYTFTNGDGIVSAVNSFISSNLDNRVELRYADGTKPAMLDWQYSINDTRVLVNVTNLEYDTPKEIEVYLDGEKLTGMKELRSGQTDISKTTLNGFEPQLLEYRFIVIPDTPAVIDEIDVDINNKEINWGISNILYEGADVYKLSNTAKFKKVATVSGTSYAYSEPGIYMLKPVLGTTETDGKWIYAGSSDAIKLSAADESTDSSFNCRIDAVNSASGYVHAVIKVEILDANGNIIAYHYNDTNIKGDKTDSFRISKPLDKNAVSAVVYAVDSEETQNPISEKITIEL